MRPRTSNEKRLLVLLAAIIFLGGNYFGYGWLSQRQSKLQLELTGLKTDKAVAEIDLEKADLWAKRAAWIKQHQPPLGEAGYAQAQLSQDVKKGASDNDLEILQQGLGANSQEGAAGTRLNVTIKVKGSMEGICKWLAGLQKPENFYAISITSLKADQDQKSMDCELQVARYYKKGA
ncbi:MAG: hypothetical protein LV479_08525 [Methylacidiphilales bacterium]|nr:hypothetical protein [Candidatus Methylacidiphilales bacterium]